MLDLMNLANTTKQVEFHESFKFVCKQNSNVCSEKQRLNENKFRCECLINKKCQNNFVWNYSNCKCSEYRKSAKLIVEEKCEEINDFTHTQKISIKKVENCKSFVAASILFVCASVISTGYEIKK